MTRNSGANAALVHALMLGAILAMLPSLARSAPTVAPAQPAPDKYLAFGLFYEEPDSSRSVDSGYGANYGFAGRLGAKRWWEARLFATTLETGIEGATDYYQYGAGLDLIQHFGKTAGGHPFALLGLGGVANDVVPDADDGVSGYANLGFGWRSAPWRGWGIRHRLELRGIYDSFDSGQIDFIAGLSLEIPSERVRVVEKVVEVEKIVEVERIVEKEVIREVPPPDSDADGVPDSMDQCPDTVTGARVEPDGCVRQQQVVVLPSIEFEFESATLTANGRAQLEPVLRFLKDQAEIELDVWGHTDWKGPGDYNQKLSEQRAAAVVRHLVDQGIAERRLSSAGFGESKPIDTNETDAGRARNRRVELNIRTGAEGGR